MCVSFVALCQCKVIHIRLCACQCCTFQYKYDTKILLLNIWKKIICILYMFHYVSIFILNVLGSNTVGFSLSLYLVWKPKSIKWAWIECQQKPLKVQLKYTYCWYFFINVQYIFDSNWYWKVQRWCTLSTYSDKKSLFLLLCVDLNAHLQTPGRNIALKNSLFRRIFCIHFFLTMFFMRCQLSYRHRAHFISLILEN